MTPHRLVSVLPTVRAAGAVRALAVAVAALALVACYKTPDPACAFACQAGGDESCPDGYTCRADNMCKRVGIPDDLVCPDLPTDASVIDTPVDGEPDASEPDASEPDASEPDAGVDAAVIDAAVIDAAAIDAAVDAAAIDADETDATVDADETDALPDA